MKTVGKVLIVAMILVLGASSGDAMERSWNWRVTPYGWLAGLEGDVGIGPVVSHVDQSFSDIIGDLEFAAMLSVDANNGCWGVMGDLFYVDIESSQSTAIGTVKGEVEQVIASAIPYVRVATKGAMTVDVGGGVRYIDTNVDVATPGKRFSGSRDWADPVVMARIHLPVAEKCFLNITADIGGFGVESDLTWQVVASAGYSITENVDLLLGYRHLDIDYEDGDFSYDVATSGLGVGVSIAL